MTTLQRLVKYPHAAVFDKAPAELTLFRLRHADGASWTIAEAVMTVRAGAASHVFDLAALKVGQLATNLTNRGFVITDSLPEAFSLSALVLVEGDGDQGTSNGDRVFGYTSLMWVLMGGYAGEIRQAGLQVVQALRQMIITQAEGEWLDLWGTLYNVARKQAETDQAYAPRIPKEAFRLRESPIAIEEAVKDATGKTIRIEEPWGGIFRLDHSMLSGPDKFADGDHVGYFLIQPTSTTPIDWTDVLPVIHRNRAAGVLVLPPFSRNQTETQAGIIGTVIGAVTSSHCREQRYEDRTLLDYSNIEDIPILNHPAIYRREIKRFSESSANGWLEHVWQNVLWPDSSYAVQSYHFRSYRLYSSRSSYEAYWPDTLWQQQSWIEFIVAISSSHSRS